MPRLLLGREHQLFAAGCIAAMLVLIPASGWAMGGLDAWPEFAQNSKDGVPVRLGDVAVVQAGPEMRRGIAELDGEGEVTGGVVILRSGKNVVSSSLVSLVHPQGLGPSVAERLGEASVPAHP